MNTATLQDAVAAAERLAANLADDAKVYIRPDGSEMQLTAEQWAEVRAARKARMTEIPTIIAEKAPAAASNFNPMRTDVKWGDETLTRDEAVARNGAALKTAGICTCGGVTFHPEYGSGDYCHDKNCAIQKYHVPAGEKGEKLWRRIMRVSGGCDPAAPLIEELATDYTQPENWHPAANCFPLLDRQALKELADDIKERGLLQPIILFEKKVLDGRNRVLACAARDITPRYEQWKGKDPIAYVASLNLKRRHLSASQLAMAAAKIMRLYTAEAKARQIAAQNNDAGRAVKAGLPEQTAGQARDKAAAAVGASPRYTQDAIAIEEASPKLAEEVFAGKKTIPEAKRELKKSEPPKPPKELDADGRYRKLYSFALHLYMALPCRQSKDEIREHAKQLVEDLG